MNPLKPTPKRSLAWLMLVVVLALAALEVATRFVFPHRRLGNELLYANGQLVTLDREMGWTLTPGVTQRIRTSDDEVVTYRTDAQGFRTVTAAGSAGPGGDRPIDVLFVGDSITFGSSANTSYPDEFSKLTRARSINAGVPDTERIRRF